MRTVVEVASLSALTAAAVLHRPRRAAPPAPAPPPAAPAAPAARLFAAVRWPGAAAALPAAEVAAAEPAPSPLEAQVREIEARRAAEEARRQADWDARWALRVRTLPALRALAAEHGVRGRARMRKAELVAAVEAARGLAPGCGGGGA